MTKAKAIQNTAQTILKLWTDLIDASNGDVWFKCEARQAYRDCLEIMIQNDLIEGYSVITKKIYF